MLYSFTRNREYYIIFLTLLSLFLSVSVCKSANVTNSLSLNATITNLNHTASNEIQLDTTSIITLNSANSDYENDQLNSSGDSIYLPVNDLPAAEINELQEKRYDVFRNNFSVKNLSNDSFNSFQ